MKAELQVLPDTAALTEAAANLFLEHAGGSGPGTAGVSPAPSVALAGGMTPRSLYARLAESGGVLWNRIHFFWGDERHVPPDHPDSNYRMAHDSLLSKITVPEENIHRIPSEHHRAQQAAEDYAGELRRHFRLDAGQWPRFDLVLLGLGPDGHTASLFPGTDALEENSRLVAAPWVEKLMSYRVTLTAPVFNNAACVVFLVSGEEKAQTLRSVLQDEGKPRFPAQLIRPTSGRLLWLADRAAAKLL